jgi:hypothetical protein
MTITEIFQAMFALKRKEIKLLTFGKLTMLANFFFKRHLQQIITHKHYREKNSQDMILFLKDKSSCGDRARFESKNDVDYYTLVIVVCDCHYYCIANTTSATRNKSY